MDLRNPKPFEWLDAVLADDRLHHRAKAVGAALFRFASPTPPLECYPGIGALQRRAGMKRRTAEMGIQDLSNLGYLETQHRPNKTAMRMLVLPDLDAQPIAHPKRSGCATHCAPKAIRMRNGLRSDAQSVADPSLMKAPEKAPEEEGDRCAAASSSSEDLEAKRREAVLDAIRSEIPTVGKQLDDAVECPDLDVAKVRELCDLASEDFARKSKASGFRGAVESFKIQAIKGFAEASEKRESDEMQKRDEERAKREAGRKKIDESIERGARYLATRLYREAAKSGELYAAEPWYAWIRARIDEDSWVRFKRQVCEAAVRNDPEHGIGTAYLYESKGGSPESPEVLEKAHWLLAKAVAERMIAAGEVDPPDFARSKLAQTA